MSKYFLSLIQEEAPRLFPPDPKRKKSETLSFNVSTFTLAVFGRKDQKAWTRLMHSPERLELDVAARMAAAVKIPFMDLMFEANKLARKAAQSDSEAETEHEKPTGTRLQ